jgi:Clostripain family
MASTKKPTSQRPSKAPALPKEGTVFAVYAPFGTDEVLSVYPNSAQKRVDQQALVLALQDVAAQGVNVSALIDLFEDDSYLVEIPANQPRAISVVSAWKQDMSTPRALAGFLRRTHQRFACGKLVLAIEGHGGGFVPDIDAARITARSTTQSIDGQSLRWIETETESRYEREDGSPALPIDSPELPIDSPELPTTRLPLSTWALGEALRMAKDTKVPRPSVIHFNNCFNASLEVLHTVAPYADFAAAYANYNFFLAGEAYPAVFARLKAKPGASAQELAQWFAEENFKVLKAKGNHPILAATVALAGMKKLSGALDALAKTLIAALRPANPNDRPIALGRIRDAAMAALLFDTNANKELRAPDQFADLGNLAVQLQAKLGAGHPVTLAAAQLQATLEAVRPFAVGDFARPYLDETQVWDFRVKNTAGKSRGLGMSIFFPDPELKGIWDWRSPYYLSGKVDPTRPPAHRHMIDFLANTGPVNPDDPHDPNKPLWVQFINEYHRGVKFVGLQPAVAFSFPVFNAKFKPKYPPPGDSGNDPKVTGKY